MKFLTKNSLPRKIIISILIALILIFSVAPSYNNVVYAAEASGEDPDSGGVAGALLKELLNLVVQLGDIAMGALNHFMLGTEGFSSAMLSPDNSNIDNPDSWLYVPKNERSGDDVESYTSEQINTANFFAWAGEHDYEIPNMLYSPEEIFANDVAALDVNFLRPNSYTAVADGDKAQEAAQSAAGGKLRDAISS